MKYNLLKLLICAAVISLSFSACIKDDTVELTDQGSTFIKILEAPTNKIFFFPFDDIKDVDLFSLRKDAATAGDQATATTVKLTLVPGYIDSYNDEFGTSFEELPDSIYTTDIPKSGAIYDLTVPAGSAGKEFSIKLNGKKWDYAHTYALAFYISDNSGKKVSSDKDTVIALLSVKNKYDGEYHSEGYLYHPASPRAIDEDKTVGTTGPSSVSVFLGDLGPNGYVANLAIDPVTNKVTVTAMPGAGGAPYTQFDAGLPATLPGYTAQWAGSTIIGDNGNRYDPDSKTFYLRYGYVGGTGWRVTEEIITRK
jgi:hypothetical protein